MELIEKKDIDVVFIQEPYIIYNRVVGITKDIEHLIQP